MLERSTQVIHTRQGVFCSAVLVATLLLSAPGHAVPPGVQVGILPPHAPRVLAGQLSLELARTLASLRAPEAPARSAELFLDPSALSQRLTRNPVVAEALRAARTAVQSAEEHTLYMRRAEALDAAGRAVVRLNNVVGQYHAPLLLARAQTARALALLLKPANEKQAQAALVQAVTAYPAYHPDGDRFPSRARRLLTQARQVYRSSSPTDDECATLATLTGVDRLVWIGIVIQKEGLVVNLVIYDARLKSTLARESMPCLGCPLVQMLATRIDQRLGPAPPALRPVPPPRRPAR